MQRELFVDAAWQLHGSMRSQSLPHLARQGRTLASITDLDGLEQTAGRQLQEAPEVSLDGDYPPAKPEHTVVCYRPDNQHSMCAHRNTQTPTAVYRSENIPLRPC